MVSFSFENKKVIIFDLDGTIVDLAANWLTLKDYLIKMYHEHYDEKCDFKRISNCLDKIVEKDDEEILKKFFNTIRKYELENIQETKLIEETIFFIDNQELFGVKLGTKYAILSLNTRDTIIRALNLARIYNKIDYIIGREDIRRWKPAPDGLFKIQKYFRVKKEEMIYFGDLKNDILTGQNAGVEAYLIEDLINFIKKKIISR